MAFAFASGSVGERGMGREGVYIVVGRLRSARSPLSWIDVGRDRSIYFFDVMS